MGVVRDFEKYRRFNLRELQASGILDENPEEQGKATKVEEQKATKVEEPEKAIKAEEPKMEAHVVKGEATEDAKPEEKAETAVEA